MEWHSVMDQKPKAKIFHDVISKKKINLLIEYYSKKPYSQIRYRDRDQKILHLKEKHSDYNVKGSIPHIILNPILKAIIGDHQMYNGAYHEIYDPVRLHVDTNQNLTECDQIGPGDKNIGILIPLAEGPKFQTIFFDYFTENFTDESKVSEQEFHTDMNPFQHLHDWMKEKVTGIPIDKIFDYKLGDLVCWDRRQLHCAANLPPAVFKTQIVIFC